MGKLRRAVGIWAVTLLLGGAALFASRRWPSSWLGVASAHGVAQPKPPPEQVVRPHQPEFVGVLLPERMANLSSRADGRLVDVKVKVGQTVRRDQVLATFDVRERQQQLAIAEGQLRAASGAASAAGAGTPLRAAAATTISARRRGMRDGGAIDL